MRLQAIQHAAGRVAEARLLILDWSQEEGGDHVTSQLRAAVGTLDGALHILTAALIKEQGENEKGERV